MRIVWAASWALMALAPGNASAGAPEDLAACQKAVATASDGYLQSLTKTVDTCLKKVSGAAVGKGADTSAAAAVSRATCKAAFRKIRSATTPTKQLAAVFDARVGIACDPAVNPKLAHAASDTWTIGGRTLGAAAIGEYCRKFGESGSISSFAQWRDCLRSATECEARQLIATRWPRALEYFQALKGELAADPGAGDALAALTAFDAALEGSIDDDLPEVDCVRARGVLVTGQTSCAAGDGPADDVVCTNTTKRGQDGFFRAGVPFDYADNGDGTITDRVTGLMWEKLADDGSVHDVDLADDWSAIGTTKIAELNGSAFAGHTDWRIPNRRELESLVKLDVGAPTIDAVFNQACTPGCSSTECSCTGGAYWSSSAYAGNASRRWVVSFQNGSLVHDQKSADAYRLRAVRGGLVIP